MEKSKMRHFTVRIATILAIAIIIALDLPKIEATKPKLSEWILGRHPNDKLNFISWLVDGCFYYKSSKPSKIPACSFNGTGNVSVEIVEHPPEFQSFDGFSNNIFHNQLGAVDTPLLRRAPPVYDDGAYRPVTRNRINPFVASEELMTRRPECGKDEKEACGSKTGKSAFLVYFGQQVVEEILDSQRPGCPPEYFNIEIPEGHRLRTSSLGKTVMPFLRSRYSQATGHSPGNPRQQLNEITPWIDGGLIYGTAKGWADVLRTFPNGTLHPYGQLASDQDQGLFPVRNDLRLPMANPPPPARHDEWIKKHETSPVKRFYVLGNPRGNENAFLLSFGVVLFRWHNQFAKYLHETRPLWSGERVFQEARKWAIGTYQQIVVYDWIPEWLGESIETYQGYDPTVDPQIEQFFQTAAMRFGHTLVTPGAYMRDYACAGCKPVPFHGLNPETNVTEFKSTHSVRTCNIFWRPQEPLEMKHKSHECLNFTGTASDGIADIDRLLMGMASQRAEREDNMIVEDLRGKVFGPLEFSRRDLMAVNLQRGRDHGTPDYNTAREAFGLKRISSVKEYRELTDTSTPIEILNKMVEIHTLNNQSEAQAWNNIDVWTGGILETSTRPGPLFRAIIMDQFKRIRNADRFWFENTRWKKPRFTENQITRIKTLRVIDMLMSVTRMLEEDIQPNPFRVPTVRETTNIDFRTKCQLNANSKIWTSSACSLYNGNKLVRSDTCYHLPQLDSTLHPVENCTEPGTYDYFSGSELSFLLTFVILGVVILGIGATLEFISAGKRRTELQAEKRRKASAMPVIPNRQSTGSAPIPMNAREWLSWKETRNVGILMNSSRLEVRSTSGDLIRYVDFSTMELIRIIEVDDFKHLIIMNKSEYDLVLEFESRFFRDSFRRALEDHLSRNTKSEVEWTSAGFKQAVANITTMTDRVAQLEKFFRAVFSEPDSSKNGQSSRRSQDINEARNLELSKTEFAQALGMSLTCAFVESMFNLVDLDQNGFISFEEFFAMLVIFKSATATEKCHYLFRMYDTDRNGKISYRELQHMIRSMVEIGSMATSEQETQDLVQQIIQSMNCGPNSELTLKEFERVFVSHASTLGLAGLDFAGINRRCIQRQRLRADSHPDGNRTARKSYIENTVGAIYSMHDNNDGSSAPPSPEPKPELEPNNQLDGPEMVADSVETKQYKHWIITWFETKRLEIFWTTLYTAILVAIFGERAYYYSVEREHGGLRHIAGYGVTLTRGFASVQMFCYATLLLTMCRNTITHLRDTFLHRFIPFDAFVSMHKYVAYLGLIGTVGHVIGHGVNFYHISTQPADDLTCLFRDYFRQTHVIPKFHYWTFQTVTGLSGILLVVLAAVIYTFSTKYARTHAFKLFWFTHALYPLWYALILLHGSGQMVQSPLFFNFLIGPLVIFMVDKLVTTGRQMFEIPVLEAELLPSQVTKIKFARPTGFEFKSGQWIRIACTALNPNEFHPFTISSSPHDSFLTVHIRAVGPFTTNIRQIYENARPKLHLDGPYGEGHQDWYRYEVSVLVGGGIGVTPFASILKDVAGFSGPRQCKKVYFLWVTRTQKQFEWLVDIIKSVENHRMISIHVFITQSHNQFDMRTVLLYACEKNFHKLNNRSLFTGLKSTTHFGRPDFLAFLRGLKEVHPNVSKFGVFSCGPPPMCRNVDESCQQINNEVGLDEPIEFQHRSEIF